MKTRTIITLITLLTTFHLSKQYKVDLSVWEFNVTCWHRDRGNPIFFFYPTDGLDVDKEKIKYPEMTTDKGDTTMTIRFRKPLLEVTQKTLDELKDFVEDLKNRGETAFYDPADVGLNDLMNEKMFGDRGPRFLTVSKLIEFPENDKRQIQVEKNYLFLIF